MVNLSRIAAARSPPRRPATMPAPPEPAIFVVRDADTTIYLFGTFHALDGKSDWFNARCETPSRNPTSLCSKPSFPKARPGRAGKPGFRPAAFGHALRLFPATTQPGDQRRPVRRACRSTTAPTWSCAAPPKPRASRSRASRRSISSSTCSTRCRRAGCAGAAPRPATRVEAPMHSLSSAMAEMQSAWKRGDQSVFVRDARPDRGGVARDLPDDVHRAECALGRLDRRRMQTPGTVFVAVGAGHLAGKDSVLVRLAERGIHFPRGSTDAPETCFSEAPCH